MFWTVTQSLFDALGQTAEIFFLTLLFGLPLGLVVAFGSMSKWQPFRFLLQPKKRKDSGTPTAETDRLGYPGYAADPPAHHHFLWARNVVRQ